MGKKDNQNLFLHCSILQKETGAIFVKSVAQSLVERGRKWVMDSQWEGMGVMGGMEGWREMYSAAETSHAGLPVWLRNEGKGHTHDTHTHVLTLTDTHSGLSMAPWLISGTQRPQTEVAEGTQWEQGLKAWFAPAPREGAREVEWLREAKREREGFPLSCTGNQRQFGVEVKVWWGYKRNWSNDEFGFCADKDISTELYSQ